MSAAPQKFSVSHLEGSEFRSDGLRPFFEYRDLGIRAATNDGVVAHVIRAVPGVPARPEWHRHEVNFQMVYVLKGWMTAEMEGRKPEKMVAGSSWMQPPGIRHREIQHSNDVEILELTSPAEFVTREVEAPQVAAE